MIVHDLKILPQYFEAVLEGKKTFEIRKNDRNFQVGDTLQLCEYKENGNYTGRCFLATITYITDFEQKDNYIVMAIKKGLHT